jgi:hypothetical protein
MRKFLFDHSLALAFVLFPFGFAVLSGLILPALGLSAQAQTAPAAEAAARRPMTFEDLMKMKRLGDTAVSPDGKWLAYSATIVDLEQNTKTAELFIQPIAAAGAASGDAKPLEIAQPGDTGAQFAPDGKRILYLSSRSGSRQIWLAEFDSATGAASNPKKLTSIATEAGDAIWSPDGHSILFTSAVYPDCPAIRPEDGGAGDKCNADRDAAAAASKVKAQSPFPAFGREQCCPRPDPQRPARCSALCSGRRRLRLRLCARLEGAGLHRKSRPGAGDQRQRQHLHPRPDQPGGETREGFYLGGRQLQPRLLARRKVPGLAFRGAGRLRERQIQAGGLRPGGENASGFAAQL